MALVENEAFKWSIEPYGNPLTHFHIAAMCTWEGMNQMTMIAILKDVLYKCSSGHIEILS